MSSELERMLDERRLTRIRADRGLICKALRESEADLSEAKDSLERGKFKWATIQGYYSAFHAVRALIYRKGLREKSHYALLIALRSLYDEELGMDLIERFGNAMTLREAADYGTTSSEAGAKETMEAANALLNKAKKVLKI